MSYITIAIFVIAAILRLVNLGAASLWYDEVFTYLVTSQDLPTMMQTIAGDVHPPLYYLLLAPITHAAGLSEFWLRLPSVIFSLVAIWLTGQIGHELGLSRRACLIAMGLVALLPSELYYAQEARMYALMQMLILAWLLATLRRQWVGAAICGVLTLYTHNYGLFYLAVIGLIGLAREMARPVILDPDNHNYPWLDAWHRGDEAQMGRAVLAAMVPGLLFAPWMLFVTLAQMGNISNNYWIQPISLGSIGYHLYMLVFVNFTADLPVISAMTMYGLVMWSVYRSARACTASQWRVLMLMAIGPALLAIAASLAWRPILTYRYLLGSLPFMCLLIGAALAALEAWKVTYIGTLCLPILAGAMWAYYAEVPLSKVLIRRDIGLLRPAWQPGDQLVHTNSSSYLLWRAYAPDLNQVLLPQCDQRNHGELADRVREALHVYDAADPTRHTWLLYDITPMSTDCELGRANALVGNTEPTIWLYKSGNTSTAIYDIGGTP